MGSSQSSPVLQKHLQQWESAVQQFDQIYNESRRVAEHDRFYGSVAAENLDGFRAGDAEEDKNERGGVAQRRPSSLVSFNNNNNINNNAMPKVNTGFTNSNINSINVGSITGNDAYPSSVMNIMSNESMSGASNSNLWSHRPHSTQNYPEARQTDIRSNVIGGATISSLSVSNTAHTNSLSNNAIVPNANTILTPHIPCTGHNNASAATSDGRVRSSGDGSAHATVRHSRQRVLELKRNRTSHFKSYELSPFEHNNASGRYGHFGAVAVALSYFLGGVKECKDRRKRVTVEDIFFAAQVPLHMLHTGPPHLPVMADIIGEFLDVDNRFKDEYGIETIHLDISPVVGQVNLGANDVGDRQTRLQLPEFRRLITLECEEQTEVIRIVNYDPYVLEQETIVDAYEDDDLIRSPLAASVLGNPRPLRRQYAKVNDGAYAVIVDVRNAVELLVTIAEGVIRDDQVGIKLTEVSAASLFKAMMSAEEGHRARGFIHIFHKESCPQMRCDEIEEFWTPELCSGKVLGTVEKGIHASVISYHISSHIVGVAWAMHLLGGERMYAHGYGNGLPVSEIIRIMHFPPEVFLDGDLSLEEVYCYAKEFLHRTNRHYTAELYPVMTKISREDAVPTISVFDLESILIDVKKANLRREAPSHVMLCMYNAGVAHNILYVCDNLQWCILAGYDEETQTALLIDAHPKMFSRTWTCALDRLHKAITGTGYIIFTNTPDTEKLTEVTGSASSDMQHATSLYNNNNNNNNDDNKNNSNVGTPTKQNVECDGKEVAKTQMETTNLGRGRTVANEGNNAMTSIQTKACVGKAATEKNKMEEVVGLVSIFHPRSIPTVHKVGAPLSTPPMVQDRLHLVEKQNQMMVRIAEIEQIEHDKLHAMQHMTYSFTFPSLPVMPTIIAMACSTIGVATTFDDVIMRLPYDISSLLIRTFTLESMHVCFTKYLKYACLEEQLHVTVYHCENNISGTSCLSIAEFETLLRDALSANRVIVAHYDLFKLLVHGARNPFGSLCIIRHYDAKAQTVHVEDCHPNSFLRAWCVTLHELYHAMSSDEITPLIRPYGCLVLSRHSHSTPEFTSPQSRNFTLKLLPVHNLFHVSPSPHFQGMSFAFAQLDHYYSPEEIFYEAFLTTMDDQRRRGSQAYAWRDVDVSLSVINKKIDAAFIALVCSKFLDSRNAHKSVMQKKFAEKHIDEDEIYVEQIDDLDLDDELHTLLIEATTTNEMVLLLNYDTEKAHKLHGFGRSVALVKSYNPVKKLVELWDAEYTVFGLSIVISVADLINIGDLDNEGRSPYGFVKFSRRASGERRKQKTKLMRAPATLEEEVEQEKIITSTLNRRERVHETTFVSNTDAKSN